MHFASKTDSKFRDGYQGRITRQSPRARFFQRYRVPCWELCTIV